MNKIVDRFRNFKATHGSSEWPKHLKEAADEIERLELRVCDLTTEQHILEAANTTLRHKVDRLHAETATRSFGPGD